MTTDHSYDTWACCPRPDCTGTGPEGTACDVCGAPLDAPDAPDGTDPDLRQVLQAQVITDNPHLTTTTPAPHAWAARTCLHCRRQAEVLTITMMGQHELLGLSCGHSCAYVIPPERRVSTSSAEPPMSKTTTPTPSLLPLGATVHCPACDVPFVTFFTDAVSQFCQACRSDLGLLTNRDAAAMIDLLDATAVGDRAALVTTLSVATQTERTSTAMMPRHLTHPPVRPATDPAKVAEAVRLMTTYGLTTPLPPGDLPTPTAYVIAANGLFEVRRTDAADIILAVGTPSEKACVNGLTDTLTPGIHLRVPKMPFTFLSQIVGFFRGVCVKDHGSCEAMVQMWWERPRPTATPADGDTPALPPLPDGLLFLHVPKQRVSGGSVNHESTFDREATGRYLHLGDIHSHGSSMGGFWSGTDNGDERRYSEGKLFGVIGKVNDPIPDWKWRMRTREGFIDLTVQDLFDLTGEPVPFTVTLDVLLGASERGAGGRVKLTYPVDPFHDATCPPEWYDELTNLGHRGTSQHGLGGTHSSFSGLGDATDWRTRRERHMSSTDASSHPSRYSPMTHYLYILDAHNILQEYAINGGTLKATGQSLPLTEKETSHDPIH